MGQEIVVLFLVSIFVASVMLVPLTRSTSDFASIAEEHSGTSQTPKTLYAKILTFFIE